MHRFKLVIVFCLTVQLIASCQSRGDVRIMFYNVENFFDTEDDPHKNDNEFTPDGQKKWTDYRYYDKRNKLYKVIANTGGWKPPELVGLCEVENEKVLLDLVNNTPLVKYPYGIVHVESPDKRGIDVALLYQKDKITIHHTEIVKVDGGEEMRLITRDILYVSVLTGISDTLHIFVNHWPSRSGGQLKSETRRIYAAAVLRHKVDSLLENNAKKKIILLGDFNDTPENISLSKTLGANTISGNTSNRELYNLSAGNKTVQGTYKYRGKWDLLDNIIVSGYLMNARNGLYTLPSGYSIIDFPFLLEEDNGGIGVKPFRTYRGPAYIGGYSDHLPVVLDLWRR